jgi:hypothetical protein
LYRFKTLPVPIIHPCWSGGMPVLVEGAAEPVSSADIEMRDPLRISNPSRRSRRRQALEIYFRLALAGVQQRYWRRQPQLPGRTRIVTLVASCPTENGGHSGG